MSKIVCIIPARMGSSRFPGKPLAKINGKAMIQHVYENACQAKTVDATYIATPDKQIVAFCRENDIKYIETSDMHERAMTRCFEAWQFVETQHGGHYDLVMLQGDEPMITGAMIDQLVESAGYNSIVNMMGFLHESDDNKNEVKVVTDSRNNALYFSREPIQDKSGLKKQVCAFLYKREIIRHIKDLPETPCEKHESIDMLRLLEHGYHVFMVETDQTTWSVDTPEELKRVERLL